MVINSKDDGRRQDDPRDSPPHPPSPKPKPPAPKHGNLGGSPGLITSTGGLYGDEFALLVPFYDSKNRNTSLNVFDSTNFNTEEDAFYYFPCPDINPGRAVTVHQVAIIYRELGLAKFSVGVIVYIRRTDTFKFIEKELEIKNISPRINDVNFAFPDEKLHTVYANLKIDGERPQVYIRRKIDDGPLSIVEVCIAGHKDVIELM